MLKEITSHHIGKQTNSQRNQVESNKKSPQ